MRASAIINKFGTVDNLLTNRHLVEDKYRELYESIALFILLIFTRIHAHANIIEANFSLTKLVDNIEDVPPLSALQRRMPDEYAVPSLY